MRVPGNASNANPQVKEVLDQQRQQWGSVLRPYEVYARRPSIFSAVVGMWQGLGESGLLPGTLTTLINRRVAALNGCVF